MRKKNQESQSFFGFYNKYDFAQQKLYIIIKLLFFEQFMGVYKTSIMLSLTTISSYSFANTNLNFFILLSLTLSLPRSSTDDLGFSVFTSNFFKLSYKISLLKNRFVTLFFIRFSQNFQKITHISSRIG